MSSNLTTGISGLDRLTGGLRRGDCIFWCVDEASRYWKLAERFACASRQSGRAVACITWRPEDGQYAELVERDSSFCFDLAGNTEKQLDAFLEFASAHGSDCFVVGIPPLKEHQSHAELTLIRLLGKAFSQLFWLDSTSYFGYLEGQFADDRLTILRDIPRILVQSNARGGTTTLRILKAPGRPLVDTQVVYALEGEELVAIQPGDPSLSDFRSIVEQDQNVVWLLGLNRELAYVSRGTLGFSRDELMLNAPALLGESNSSAASAPIVSGMAEALRTRKAVTGIETRSIDRKTGNEEYFVHNIIPLHDRENRPYGFLGTSTNVTELTRREKLLEKSEAEQRRLAEQLSKSERKYKGLFNSAVDIMSVVDREGRLVDVNPACCKLTGYSREELLDVKCADLVEHFDRDRFLSIFEGGSHPWSVRTEYTFVSKDGVSVPLEVSAVMLDEDHVLFVSRDVSERKMAEAKLKASEEMFRSLVRQAGLGIVYFNAQGDYLDANDALCEMTGYSREELMGAGTPRPYSPNGYVLEHLSQVGRALAGRTDVIETVFRRKNGEVFPVRIHPSSITDHTGEQVGLIGIIEDVTAWKELQRQVIHAQRMDVASFLAVGIAHEFNNLHGGIQNHVELILEDEALPSQVRKDLQVILKTLRRASGITKQLDKFARRIPPNKEPSSLSEVIGDTLDLLSREYENEGIKIDLQNGRGIPELVMDSAQIGQVLLNLFINARDAMRGRAPKILRVETGFQGGRVFVKVSDTGVGIAGEHIEHIFEPVFTTKRNVDGTSAHGLGLGLAVCKTIVREHGGEIGVSSTQGVGTTFTVWLPAEANPPEGPAADERRSGRDGTA
ncbi:MAG: PAS domain S-box protein [Candidatus Eisenbacteria bacterium]|nr:PAS domain S-box protein [Candidatus Eisenbacteria bacterium]